MIAVEVTLNGPPIVRPKFLFHQRKEKFLLESHVSSLSIRKAARCANKRAAWHDFVSNQSLHVLAESAYPGGSIKVFPFEVTNRCRLLWMRSPQLIEYRIFFGMVAVVWIIAEIIRNTLEQLIIRVAIFFEDLDLVFKHIEQPRDVPMFITQCIDNSHGAISIRPVRPGICARSNFGGHG